MEFMVWHAFFNGAVQPVEGIYEGGLPGEISAQNEGVDEGTDQRFQFDAVSTRQQSSDIDVVLASVVRDEHLQCRERERVKRATAVSGQCGKRIGEGNGKDER